MLTLKEQAVNMVKSLPDEKMTFIIEILRQILGILDDKSETPTQAPIIVMDNPPEAIKAWERFKVYKGIIPYDLDPKAELANARDEKYADSV